jgi:uncharacterized protein (DUF305 family)
MILYPKPNDGPGVVPRSATVKQILRLAILSAGIVQSACASGAGARPSDGPAAAGEPPEAPAPAHAHEHAAEMQALPASAGPGFTVADVHFMQHMIGHHAQAVVMAGMAPTHGAGDHLLKLAEKIDISQRDEIAFMKRWLDERGQAVPDDARAMAMQMPGMLTPAQMTELGAARGVEFERLFLTFMIQHHRGALSMVDALFDSPAGGQDPDIFRFATDVDADQRDEIYVMETMLDMLQPDRGSRTR